MKVALLALAVVGILVLLFALPAPAQGVQGWLPVCQASARGISGFLQAGLILQTVAGAVLIVWRTRKLR